MFIDHKLQLAYLALPKTGSYSIHSYFGYQRGHPEPILHHMSAELMVAMYPETVDYYKFAFVRNPWDKFVSVYHDLTQRRIFEFSGQLKTQKRLLSEFKDFEDCCRNIRYSSWFHNVFFKPQSSFLFYVTGKVDFVGKFECLQKNFDTLCEIRGLPKVHLQHLNNGVYDHGYRQYYTPQTMNIIGDLYADDIRNFNYDF